MTGVRNLVHTEKVKSENLKGRDPDIDGRIMLKLILKK
jgi:hypothetical protein